MRRYALRGSPRRLPGEGTEAGFALLVVVVLLLVITAVAHAALFVARQDHRAEAARRLQLRTRMTVDGGIERTAAAWDARRWLALSPGSGPVAGETGAEAEIGWSTAVRRLDRELYLVESRGGPPRGRLRVAAGRLFWSPDPAGRTEAHVAALTVAGGATVVGSVDGMGVEQPPPGWAGIACDTLAALVDTLFPAAGVAGIARGPDVSVVVEPGASLTGEPDVLPLPAPPAPGLGLLSLADLALLAEIETGNVVTPSPRVDDEGRCLPDPLNWGDPVDPESPCGGRFPVVRSEAELEMGGGQGQGLLLVERSLVLSGDARFAGIVLVAGDLRVEDTAVLRGFATVGGRVSVGDGARVEASACPALRALAATPLPGRLYRLPGGSWLDLYPEG